MANLSQVNRGETYITLRISNLTYPANEYYLYIKNDSTGEESGDLGFGSATYSDSYTFSGLNPSTTYSFTGRAWHAQTSGQWVYFSGTFGTTTPVISPPSSPSVYLDSQDKLEVTFQVIAPSNTTKLQYYTSWNGSYSSELGATAGNSYYPSYTVPNYNTSYYFEVRAGNAGGWSSWARRNFTTPSQFVRPTNFSWSSAKTSGSTFNVTASEWNNLTDRINQFRIYKELNEYAFYLAYYNDPLSAVMFNQAVNAISGMSPPTLPPGTVSSGSTIYASQLNGLRNSLNSIT